MTWNSLLIVIFSSNSVWFHTVYQFAKQTQQRNARFERKTEWNAEEK